MQQLEQPDQPAVGNGTRNGTFGMKGHEMNTQIQASEHLTIAPHVETDAPERDRLAQWGFSSEEIASLLWLRQWYQTGGSDRARIVRYLEFLRLLVSSGELEL